MFEPQELKPGLTWRSFLAIILTAVMFIPVSIFTALTFGGSVIGSVAVAAVTLIFTELMKYSFNPLTKQEVLMVYYGAGIGGVSGVIYQLLIYRSYFVNSPFSHSAKVGDVPLALLVPEWLAPKYGSPAYQIRSLFQPEYAPGLLVYTIRLALTVIAQISISMMMARTFLQIKEEFPFPFAEVDNAMVTFIGQRPPDITKFFLFTMIPGIIWALIAYVSPILLGIMLIPIPYWDLTLYLRDYIPGAAIGIATSLSSYVGGMMIPFTAAAYMLMGSITVWVILNSLFATTYTNLFPRWSAEFFKGMGLATIQQRSYVTVWFAPQIGLSLAAAAYIMYKIRRVLFIVFSAIFKRGQSNINFLGFPSTNKLLIIYIAVSSFSVALHQYLIPELPLWVPFFAAIVYPFLLAIVLTAQQGVVGTAVAPSYVWQSLVYISPYQGYAGFVFEPLDLSSVASLAPGFTQSVKVAMLNEMRPFDLVKLYLISAILASIIGLAALNFFWSIAPMPSVAYPATLYSMPAFAQIDVFTATRQLTFTPQSVLIPAIILLLLCFSGDFASKFGFPFSLIGLISGPFLLPAAAISTFVGSAIAKFVMNKMFKERWFAIRGPIVAGTILGEGLVLLIIMSIRLMGGAAWIWPW